MRSRPALRAAAGVAAVALGALGVGACASGGGDSAGRAIATPLVGVAFFPIADIVDRMGLAVDPVVLVPPGQEAHEYDPTPKDLTRLEDASVFFYLGQGFQPNVQSAIASLPDHVQKVDLLRDLTLRQVTDPLAGTEGTVAGETLDGDKDPHVWLDPAHMATMADAVAAGLVRAGVVTQAEADAGLARALAGYDELDRQYRDGLASCSRRDLVTTHRAFGYLADAYGLTNVSIAGMSPSEEPSAKTLEAVAAFVEERGVTTIFSEENLPADLAATVAEETGASTATLDTLESPSTEQLGQGDDYATLMLQNLAAIRAALGCS